MDKDIRNYTILIYGREKIGKSTAFSGFPGAIFFATEPGTKGLDIFEFNSEDGGVKDWDIFREGVRLLEGKQHGFHNVIIDTVDRAYDMCLDWVCENRGIEYPGEDSAGSQDFGKSWRAVKNEFTEQIHKLRQAGMGIGFVSHAREFEFRSRSGEKYTRIFPSMSNQARTVVEALVDFFFYAEYSNVGRILICDGDETVWAGARSAGGRDFPKFLPLERERTYATIKLAFEGQYKGIPIDNLKASRATSKTAEGFIKRASMHEKRGGEQAGGKRKIMKKKR